MDHFEPVLLRDAERRVVQAEASFSKQLKAVHERASAQGLGLERRLREEAELAQRLSSRNNDLQVGFAVLLISTSGPMGREKESFFFFFRHSLCDINIQATSSFLAIFLSPS